MQNELSNDRIQAVLAELMSATGKRNAGAGKINLKAQKLSIESKWRPVTVASAIIFAFVATDRFFGAWTK